MWIIKSNIILEGNTVLYKLQYSLVLRSPALPRVVFLEEYIHNNVHSEVMIQINDKDWYSPHYAKANNMFKLIRIFFTNIYNII
jgi:hypothetical protein